MKTAFFSTHHFERDYFDKANRAFGHELIFYDASLDEKTVDLTKGCEAVCAFVSDSLNEPVLRKLKENGVKIIALRSAGYNHVDISTAEKLGIPVVRVPEYSPFAVAEHAVCLLLAINRKIHRAYNRVREGNFSLDGLVGFDLHGKTVGVLGTGKIGSVFCKIMAGFGCKVLGYDREISPDLLTLPNFEYTTLDDLYKKSDVISLHLPLTPETFHIVDQQALEKMKKGVILINTGRGALINATALIKCLKKGALGGACLDVYEEEEGVFFEDLSEKVIQDDTLARLLTFPNVLITAHQAFLTKEALENIAKTTLCNLSTFENTQTVINGVSV